MNMALRPAPAVPVVPRPVKLPSELLLERGWCRNTVEDSRGRLCLAGAVFESALRLAGTRQALTAVLQEVIEERVGRRTFIPAWNDRETTSFDDVLAVAREAEHRLGWRP